MKNRLQLGHKNISCLKIVLVWKKKVNGWKFYEAKQVET